MGRHARRVDSNRHDSHTICRYFFNFYRASLWKFYVPVLTRHDYADSFLLRVKDTTQQPCLPEDTGDRARTQVVN